MRPPLDIAVHVSPQLSAIIDGLTDDPDVGVPVTLRVITRERFQEEQSRR